MQKLSLTVSFIFMLTLFSACKQKDGQVSDVEMARGTLAKGSEPFLESFVSLAAEAGDSLIFRCSGVLVGPRHVLTAAHCLESIRSLQVTGYDAQLNKTTVLAGAWMMHPGWAGLKNKPGPEAHKSDLGIVILGSELQGPFAKIGTTKARSIKNAIYVGVGRSDGNVRDGKIRFAKNIEAENRRFPPEGGTWISKGSAIICSGDSGGPLFSGDGTLIGIAAAVGFKKDEPDICGSGQRVYHADVQLSLSWISCQFSKAGYPLPDVPLPRSETCQPR